MPNELKISIGQHSDKGRKDVNQDFYGVAIPKEPQLSSKGVAVAFYNTFFGLTIATLTVVAYLIVSVKQGRDMARIEFALASLVDQLLVSGEPQRPALRVTR